MTEKLFSLVDEIDRIEPELEIGLERQESIDGSNMFTLWTQYGTYPNMSAKEAYAKALDIYINIHSKPCGHEELVEKTRICDQQGVVERWLVCEKCGQEFVEHAGLMEEV